MRRISPKLLVTPADRCAGQVNFIPAAGAIPSPKLPRVRAAAGTFTLSTRCRLEHGEQQEIRHAGAYARRCMWQGTHPGLGTSGGFSRNPACADLDAQYRVPL